MRTVFTSSAYDFNTQTEPTAYARCRAAIEALWLHAAGVPGVRLVPTCRDLGDHTVPCGYGRFETRRRYDQSWTVTAPDAWDADRVGRALAALGWKRSDLGALAWGMGHNAYVALGGHPMPVGAPDALAWPGVPSDLVRARLAPLATLEAPTVHVPYTPPPYVPEPGRGECPAGHPGRATAWARSGRWAGWYTCATCRRHFDRNGFGLGL